MWLIQTLTKKSWNDRGDEIIERIRSKRGLDEVVQVIDTVSSCMLLLQSLVSNIGVWYAYKRSK